MGELPAAVLALADIAQGSNVVVGGAIARPIALDDEGRRQHSFTVPASEEKHQRTAHPQHVVIGNVDYKSGSSTQRRNCVPAHGRNRFARTR